MSQRSLLSFSLVLIAVLWLSAQFAISARSKYSTTSTYSRSATGVSVLYQLAAKLGANARVKKSAILGADDLLDTDVFLLLSPRQPISKREAALLATFVQNGGDVVLSFESERSWGFLQPVLAALSIDLETHEDPKFENRSLEQVYNKSEKALFSSDRTYGFYGRLIFNDGTCASDRFSCFFRESRYGKGTVHLIAGLPPIGNVLLPLEQNREVAFHFLSRYHNIVFDEYRHFFSDKTLKDLFLNPSFSLPLLGLAMGALGFFLFGYSEAHSVENSPAQPSPRSAYHDLNSGIFHGLLDRSGSFDEAVKSQQRYLEHHFPNKRAEIAKEMGQNSPPSVSDAQSLARATKLAALHRRFLEEKGFWNQKV